MKYHFIAIGGAVMHQLAICLKNNGHEVSGSDDIIFDPAKSNLAKSDLLPDKIGWNENHINSEIDAIILGMHARKDNMELKKAQQLNIPVYSFPEFVFQHAKSKKRVVIAGSHGKTTITAMIVQVLNHAKLNFDYLVGSKIEGIEGMVSLTEDAPIIVIEGDEYLSSPIDSRSKFLHYQPDIAVISGIAWDHINVFPTFEAYEQTFCKFLKSMESEAIVFYYQPDDSLTKIIHETKPKFAHEIYRIPDKRQNENGEIEISILGQYFQPKVFGDHNFANLNAAAHVCDALKIEHKKIIEGSSLFGGTANRLEHVHHYQDMNFEVFRDFAHAPSKVKATVSAIKQKYPKHHFVAVFELHTYSSLQADFLEHYDSSLEAADIKIVHQDEENLKIKKRSTFPKEQIRKAFNEQDIKCTYDKNELESELKSIQTRQTVVLLMSSGHFSGLKISDWIK